MVQNTKAEYDVELFTEHRKIINGTLHELDVALRYRGSELCLCEVMRIGFDGHDALRPAALHLDCIKAGVGSDVQHRHSGKVSRQRVREARPLHRRVVAEKMRGSSLYAVEPQIMKPRLELSNLRFDLLVRHPVF